MLIVCGLCIAQTRGHLIPLPSDASLTMSVMQAPRSHGLHIETPPSRLRSSTQLLKPRSQVCILRGKRHEKAIMGLRVVK
eukprot:6203873-Pleurochrysis_carterae.AAC.6